MKTVKNAQIVNLKSEAFWVSWRDAAFFWHRRHRNRCRLKTFFQLPPSEHRRKSNNIKPRVALKSFTFPSFKYFLRRILNLLLVQLENRPTSRDRRLEPIGISACEFKKGGFLHRENPTASQRVNDLDSSLGGFLQLHSRENSIEIEKCFKNPTSCEKLERYKK